MKTKVNLFCNLMLFCIFSFDYGNQAFGQDKVNMSVGIGLPELLNIGVRYQLDQTQIGISFGSIPGNDIISISSDVYYHFGGFSELSNRRPWYGKVGLNYFRDETETIIDQYIYLNLRVGRDINISEKIGIEIDAGAIFQLSREKIRKKPSSGWLDFDLEFPVLPSVGIGVFYRI